MSAQSEESPIDNPLEALRALTRDRVEPRLTALSSTPLARPPTLDTARPTALAAGDRLESAMSEFVRRQIRPEVVPEPAGLKREGMRAMVMAGAAIVAVAGVVALLYVTLFPSERDVVRSFAAAAPAAAPSPEANDVSKPPLSQSRALVVANGGGDNISHEQSERLLQQFVQWRQKAALTDKQ